jgi:hypothetical protein
MKATDMRMLFVVFALLYSTAAFAQGATPTVGDKPLVQVKPKAAPKAASKKPASMAVKLQECTDIDDGTKERLDCYDTVVTPAPNPKAPKAKTVNDCHFVKEQDERLTCYNRFVESMPKLPRS